MKQFLGLVLRNKAAGLLLVCAMGSFLYGHTQNVGIGTTNPVARLHVTDSNVVFSAIAPVTDPVGYTLPVNGPGARLMWMPAKAAFRVGLVQNDSWNADSIGFASVAMGGNTRALGAQSFAMGTGAKAYGASSVALGNGTTAIGNFSTAIGINNLALGIRSTAMGSGTTAAEEASLATGVASVATGISSSTFGRLTYAKAYVSVALGQLNDSVSTSSNTSWVGTDPLVYVGNGTALNARHNTFVIYKNGNIISKNPTPVLNSNNPHHVPVTGTGTRLFWNPEISAFRVGTVTGNQWDFLGAWSFAAGYDVRADGNSSVAFGLATQATGNFSTTFGVDTRGTGNVATTFGEGTIANAYGSLSIGRYNDYISSSTPNSWVPTDPLMILGNGSSDLARSNAVVFYKNGNTDINGYTQLGTTAEAAPSIKMKKLTGTSSAIDGGDLSIPHGLNRSKIIGVQVLLQYTTAAGGGDVLPGYTESNGFEYSVSVTATSVNIFLVPGNCASILNKPVRVLVTYEE